jgi:3-oxoacyl-[acyl-carrier protein] reductase
MAKRIVLITGGTNGIGKATAERFAKDGDTVIAWGTNDERIKELADGIIGKKVGVSDPSEVDNAVKEIVKEYGKVDVLVCAAGVVGQITTETPYEEAQREWNRLVGVNLTGSFLTTQAASKHVNRKGGRIILISSVSAFTGSMRPGGIGYAASKAGVNGLMLALSRELGPQGITVNAVSPGFIGNTGITSSFSYQDIKNITSQSTVPKLGQPEDIAAAIYYLASPEAKFVNGEIHHVNGGWLPGR